MNIHFTVWVRKPMIVNTDPQRRCYNGCNFSERVEWSEWCQVAGYASKEDAESAIATFQSINPRHEYKLGNEAEGCW